MIANVLSIAGFDSSGGAGLQADLKTFSALGCYGMSILTALPIQNTQGVKNCYEIPLSAIEEQLDIIFDDIKVDAIKIGMLFTEKIINRIADFLKKKATCPIVVDPVMVAKSGHLLLKPEAITALKEKIFPLAKLITPNLPEAEQLLMTKISTRQEMEKAAEQLLKFGSEFALIKGGHLPENEAADFLKGDQTQQWFEVKKINTKNTHGTGCTLSSAIAAYLAQGVTIPLAIEKSKAYLTDAIRAGASLKIGLGNGPVDHFYFLNRS